MANEFSEREGEEKSDTFDWQQVVSDIIIKKEYNVDVSNAEGEHKEMESILDLLICDRSEKDYDWQSDIFIPDFPSIHWTQIGELVAQYFSRYDKVDCPPATDDPVDVLKSKAAKKFINYHLNARYMHYLQKFIRQNSFNRLMGYSVIKMWYESDVQMVPTQTGTQIVPRGTGFDIYGTPIEESQFPEQQEQVEEPIIENIKQINTDRPNFDVWPNQDVFMDNKYCYSLQDKDHIIFRDEVKLSKLLEEADASQYFNLELLQQDINTGTEQETYNKKDKNSDTYDRIIQKYDPDIERLERWGKWPVILTEDGRAINGIDEKGEVVPEAQLIEMIITVVNIKKGKHVIRFQPNLPEFGGYGFRPMTRLMCFIHPTKDKGIGDGKYGKELQVGINDTFNMNNDRTRMATFPTIKKRKFALVDNDTLQFGPEHVMEVENMDDVDIIQIDDNIQGGLIQQDMLFGKMQQVLATYTTDMGGVPARKEPVTTVMLASQKSNIRTSLVNLTVEHTGLGEFYDIMLKMSGMFMQPETLFKILGDMTFFFDPDPEYNFVPVSTSILTEHAKETKIQQWDQILGRIVNIPNPRTFALVNMIMREIMELYGKEYAHYGNFLLDENSPHPEFIKLAILEQQAQAKAAEGGGKAPAQKKSQPVAQNEQGFAQSALEQRSRQTGTLAGGGTA